MLCSDSLFPIAHMSTFFILMSLPTHSSSSFCSCFSSFYCFFFSIESSLCCLATHLSGACTECGGSSRDHISPSPRHYQTLMVPHLTVRFCVQLPPLCCSFVWLELAWDSYQLLEMFILTMCKLGFYLINECSFKLFPHIHPDILVSIYLYFHFPSLKGLSLSWYIKVKEILPNLFKTA